MGQVGVALLVGPIRCRVENTSSFTSACTGLAPFRPPTPAALTFADRHVDALAIPAQRVRPPEGPGHVVEHRVVGPAEAAVVLVGVEPQPPVVALHFVHLRRMETQFKIAHRSEVQKRSPCFNNDTATAQVCACKVMYAGRILLLGTDFIISINFMIKKRALPCVKCWPGKPLPLPSGQRPTKSATKSRSSGPGPKWCGGRKIYTRPPGSRSTLVKWCLTDQAGKRKDDETTKDF